MPSLSIIIPTYKRTDSLERLLDCLIHQDTDEIEIIIVDQNSENFFDSDLLAKLKKFIYVYQEYPNTSLARNNGFKFSKAPYILFLDDDLIPEKDFCTKGLSFFNDYPEIGAFVPLVYPDNAKEEWKLYGKQKTISVYPGQDKIFLITDYISAAVFFRRTYFELSGGFDIHLFAFAKASEDVELFLRMRQRKMALWYIPYIEILHDETTEGGCEMRTAGYWITRKKNARAMAFRYRIHNKVKGKLLPSNLIQLIHSFIINREVLRSGMFNLFKEIGVLINSVKESKIFFDEYKHIYLKEHVDFLR